MNIAKNGPMWHGRTTFGYFHKRDIAGCSSRSITKFSRKLQIDFKSDCTSLQSHQQWRSVPLFLYPRQHVLSPEVLVYSDWCKVESQTHFDLYFSNH